MSQNSLIKTTCWCCVCVSFDSSQWQQMIMANCQLLYQLHDYLLWGTFVVQTPTSKSSLLYRKRLYFFSLCSEEQQKTHKDFLSNESFIIIRERPYVLKHKYYKEWWYFSEKKNSHFLGSGVKSNKSFIWELQDVAGVLKWPPLSTYQPSC